MGLKYDTIFPIGERRISLRGWQNAFAQCSYFMHLFVFLLIKVPPAHNFPCVLPKMPPLHIITPLF